MKQIQELEEMKAGVEQFQSEIDRKLINNEITQLEHKLTIHEKLLGKTKQEIINHIDNKIEDIKQKNRKKLAIATSTVTMLILIIAFTGTFYIDAGITGNTIATIQYNSEFSNYTQTQLNITNITSLKITGTIEGDYAKIILRTDAGEYLIAEFNQSTVRISTDKKIYSLGETVTITTDPENSQKTVYIQTEEENTLLTENTYTPNKTGEYTLTALITTDTGIERVQTKFNVTTETIIEQPKDTIEFNQICLETCSIPTTNNPILIIEPGTNSKITITEITTNTENTQTENNPPTQTQIITDIILTTRDSTTINLNEYFNDVDEETITYDINTLEGINSAINQGMLTITATNTGTHTARVYATDGTNMITSNEFTITAQENQTTQNNNSINETANETTTETNQTTEFNLTADLNNTINNTNNSIIQTSDCTALNPNERPVDCMQGNEEQYFQDKSIIINDGNRKPVARITAFGNFKISGELIENSQNIPGEKDFRISYSRQDEEDVVTAWINSETGDLNLKGKLFEEQFELSTEGKSAYIIQNRKGTNLGYFDRIAGDLYLRGNLISEKPRTEAII